MSDWEDVDWSEFCDWIVDKLAVKVSTEGDRVTIRFSDGSVAQVVSEMSPGYSELTPAEILPPSVRIRESAR